MGDEIWTNRCAILFIPFEAVGKHVEKNAEEGVDGERMRPDGTVETIQTEEPGAAMAKKAIIAEINSIVSQHIKNIQEDVTGNHAYLPKIIFLSEEPKAGKGKDREHFPDSLEIKVEKGDPIAYEKIGEVGKRAVQRIIAYKKCDLSATITCEELKWKDPVKDKIQHVLMVKFDQVQDPGFTYTIAGVHLTSEYVNTSDKNYPAILEAIKKKCKDNEIDLVVGDFNFDIAFDKDQDSDVSQGFLGTAIQSDRVLASDRDRALAVLQPVTLFSNSVNNKHFMGIRLFYQNGRCDKIRLTGIGGGVLGRCLQRSSPDGDFYSDHPPLYCVLESVMKSEETEEMKDDNE